MYYEVFQRGGLWYWHLKGGNNEIIANGEGYTAKSSALHAISLVKASQNAPVYER
ncbi:DUF1508 domain-containing protein [Luteolibacter ambystomatis]|uniref:DUF1508 domain-containing protein n=1 Tax=Luteolibacter ambystomatis TaxID=2824561 RepID=A0A975G962_9BACT|nr:DUF1508 domain-containing protein [Luteolibacter ambystomatis]QUE51142.1 DUF1508 domain-containing protein [Luteolibacter ambystomatis]